jgi:hypothetical protein
MQLGHRWAGSWAEIYTLLHPLQRTELDECNEDQLPLEVRVGLPLDLILLGWHSNLIMKAHLSNFFFINLVLC